MLAVDISLLYLDCWLVFSVVTRINTHVAQQHAVSPTLFVSSLMMTRL
jgi:hypothetical protein